MTKINDYTEAAREMIGQCGEILHVFDGFITIALIIAFLVGLMLGHAASGMFTRLDFYLRQVIRERAKRLRHG